MDKRAWYKNKKGFFHILVLFQTGVILFTATYVVLFVRNTRNGKSVGSDNGYRRYYDLKSENRRRTYERKAFNILVRAKGRVIDNHKGGNSKTSSNGRNQSDIKNYKLKNKDKINKSSNNRNGSNSKKHINMRSKKTSSKNNKNNSKKNNNISASKNSNRRKQQD
jgi:hypothetical protein